MVAVRNSLARMLGDVRTGACEKDTMLPLKSTGPDAHTKKILHKTSHSEGTGAGPIPLGVMTEVTF